MTRHQVVVGAGCVFVGILGAALGVLTWHLWQDHTLLHNMHSYLEHQAERAAPSATRPVK